MASAFFDKFPKVKYNVTNAVVNKRYEDVTNVFIRIAYLKDILKNVTSYYVYEVEDGETPEVLAQMIYEDVGAAWMILYANEILDPQFEWPLDYDSFQKYIIDKYGSIENAKTNIHHYEKVVTRKVDTGPEEIITETRFTVNENKLTDNEIDVPYDYYENLPETQDYEVYDVGDRSITEIIKRDAISYYDYENQINENRRFVKVIKKEYYGKIMGELDNMVGYTNVMLRRVM